MKKLIFLLTTCLGLLTSGPALSNADEAGSTTTSHYVELSPDLLVNLADARRYVRVSIQLLTRDDTSREVLENHKPALRHALIMLLSEQRYKEVLTPQGQLSLRDKALSASREALANEFQNLNIETLLFTKFLVD